MATIAPTTTTGTSGELARPQQAADHFKVTTMTLYRWRKLPGFPQPLKRGQVVLYNTAAIEAWLGGNL